ncbi:MAG: hypothetical protein ACKODH_00760 [Limisphaerales bacterium]
MEGGGAYVVRFTPHTKQFEQPPVQINFQKFVPAERGGYDFVLGYSQSTVQPFVRVVKGFTSMTAGR